MKTEKPSMKMERPFSQAGFTLVELVMVIVLLAIVAVTVSIRWTSAGERTVPVQADLLAGNIRHLQALATAQGRTLRLNINPDRYCVTVPPETDCALAIVDPATSLPFTVVLADAVTLTGTSTDLDSLGRPKNAAGLLAASRIFQLTADSTTWSVTLIPISGFVTVTTP